MPSLPANPLRIFLTGLVLLLAPAVFSQQYNFKNYSVENGLPYIQIASMYQDSKGYIWSGGYGGLSRFDGKTFISYSPKNGLINHNVTCIIEDTSGSIFVSTIKGVSRLTGNKIRNYTQADGLPDNRVNTLLRDRKGRVWAGTHNGLCYFDGQRFVELSYYKGKQVLSLTCDRDNNLWIGTTNGLYKFNKTPLAYFNTLKGLPSNTIYCLSICPGKKKLVIGTDEGMSILDTNGRFTNLHISNGLIDEKITSVLCEDKDVIWVGSPNGLLKFNGVEFSYFNINNEYNANHVRCLIKDFEQNLWVGTNDGIFKFTGTGFIIYSKQDGLGNAFIYQITRDTLRDELWVGTENDGAYKYSQGYFKNYRMRHGLIDNHVKACMLMDDGSIWFGTEKGISRLQNEKFQTLETNLVPPINVFYRDRKGRLWVGATAGLACMTPNAKGGYDCTYYGLPSPVDKYEIWGLAEDMQGDLWVGTYLGGLFKLVNNTFEYQNPKYGLSSESFLTLCIDRYNNLYAATLDGVLALNLNTSQHTYFTETNGLNSELVYSLLLDRKQEAIWAGTNQGINRIDLGAFRRSGVINVTAYGKAEGFKGVECNTNGVYEEKNGDIWFGTVNGLIKYVPSQFKVNTYFSKTNITNIQLFYKDTLLPQGAVLPHAENNISFHYKGICMTNPDKVRYIHKLEGFDKQWSPESAEDFVSYSNLPPGMYTFKVKSCNNEGMWNLEATSFSFEIRPPFYKTWWFILLTLALGSGIIFGAFGLRLRQVRRQQELDTERQVELSKVELKALRAQMNPHFVFNSLNSIQHYILNSKGEQAVKYLNKFARLIRIILNNSEKSTVTINEDLEALQLYLELEQMRFAGKFDYEINIQSNVDPDYDLIPPMLMQPYVENAILHGLNPRQEKGLLVIDIANKNNYIVCTITDNGIGREKAKEMKRTQAPGKAYKSMGMKITQDRLSILNHLHQSELSVRVTDLYDEQRESCGTKIELFIPIIG